MKSYIVSLDIENWHLNGIQIKIQTIKKKQKKNSNQYQKHMKFYQIVSGTFCWSCIDICLLILLCHTCCHMFSLQNNCSWNLKVKSWNMAFILRMLGWLISAAGVLSTIDIMNCRTKRALQGHFSALSKIEYL